MGLVILANKRPYRFFISKASIILSIAISFMCLVFAFILSLEINKIDEIAVPAYANSDGSNIDINILQENLKKKVFFGAFKDIFVVVCSIFGTNLLLSLIIQKKAQNDMYDEFLTEDLLKNKKFLKSMDESKRHFLLQTLEKIEYLKDSQVYSELINSVRNKIIKSDYQYYYVSHKTEIVCYIKPQYIEKSIVKTIEVRSFDKSETIKDFAIAKIALEKINNTPNVEIKELKIDGKTKNVNNCIKYLGSSNTNDSHFVATNYNKCGKYCLSNDITFYNDKSTTIEIVYITRVPLNDKIYTSRLSVPCQEYGFRFRIEDSNTDYKICAQAFGFQEDAETKITNHRNEIIYEMSDWIFSKDGVFVTFDK